MVTRRAALAELKKMEYKLDKEIRDMGGKIDNPLKEAEEERSKSSTVYMGNLSYTTTKESIEKFFKEEDLKVCGVRLPGGEDKVASRGFAFVEFSREADMRNAIALLDGATLDTRKKNGSRGHATRKDEMTARLGGEGLALMRGAAVDGIVEAAAVTGAEGDPPARTGGGEGGALVAAGGAEIAEVVTKRVGGVRDAHPTVIAAVTSFTVYVISELCQ
ncbi:hypothetical protein FOZ63_009265 [Perkinsus olseni]|uniref:RRM domain-containing protein n=1 Tax=Perkinsus olseni TaxID=32597 RepID=A0A7J6TCA8_PEROL|nr:hypothetical protein FOZ63_009265 [Perkinsus olseni]